MLTRIVKHTFRLPRPTLLMGSVLLFALEAPALSMDRQYPYAIDVAAPELVCGPWLNTPKNAPIKLAARKGKVTIVEFWTFG